MGRYIGRCPCCAFVRTGCGDCVDDDLRLHLAQHGQRLAPGDTFRLGLTEHTDG